VITIPHLETDITQACQMSCVACNHSVPLWRTRKGGPWSADPVIVQRDLTHLAKFMHTPVWGALGGEPTLHPKLVDILKIARDSGIADQLEVWTNGLTLSKMSKEFWKSFDILVISIYPDKMSEAYLSSMRQVCVDNGVVWSPRDERLNPNFKTMLESVPTSPVATKQKYDGCFFRHFSRSASYGFFFTCCCGPHIPMLIQDQPFGTDGIRIEDIPNEEVLHAYLTKTDPLGACTVCAGRDTAVSIPWSEEKNPLMWVRKSQGVEA
jgi:GTP 3',8-cyclase